jgi:hypothetical protein
MEHSKEVSPLCLTRILPIAGQPSHGSDVVDGTNAASIPTITAGHLLLPSSLTRRPMSVPCGHAFRPQWRMRPGDCEPYFVSLHKHCRGKVAPLGRWCNIRVLENAEAPTPDHLPFGPSHSAAWARRTSRPLSALQFVLTSYPALLLPTTLCGWQSPRRLTLPRPVFRPRLRCPAGFRRRRLPR